MGRGKPKTADELDAEMMDYFDASGANGAAAANDGVANGAAQPAANGADDLGMDEISVCITISRLALQTALIIENNSERQKGMFL